MDPIAVAVPLFFVAIAVELWIATARGRRVYRFVDAVTDLSCGILQQVTVQWLVFLHGPYAFVVAHAPALVPAGAAQHVVAFLGVDLGYYWWHRFTHESNLGWATHVVHHQSEDYNLAVALRQSVTSALTSWPFHLPLGLLGVPAEVVLLHSALNTLYQFWIHTELVGWLGPLELVINTPSAHRVHHAVNPRYLDRNYAGVLIVWDRLFGTYVREDEPCVYGTVERFRSLNPLYANTWWLQQVASDARAAPSLREALWLLVARPAWRPTGLPPHPTPAEVDPSQVLKYDPAPFPWLRAWVVAQFVGVAAAVEVLLLTAHTAPAPLRAATAVLVALSVLSWGGWFERRPWVAWLDPARVPLLAGVLAGWFSWPVAAVGAGLALVASIAFVRGPGASALGLTDGPNPGATGSPSR